MKLLISFQTFRCCIYPANKCKNAEIFWHFYINEQDKCYAQLNLAWKKFNNLKVWSLALVFMFHNLVAWSGTYSLQS